MLKRYASKFAMDILPSVAATIIGAYIVNHYIVTKPGADAPAAAASTADPKKAAVRNDAKPSGTSSDVASIPEAGVKAKGISEKAMIEKTAAERPAAAEKPQEKPQEKLQEKLQEKPQEKSVEKPADKPAETASIPVEPRRHQPPPREKAIARAVPAPVTPSAPPVVAAPIVAAPTTAPVEAVVAPEERRDANDLARAAIERLRGSGDASPRPQEAARIPETPRVPDAPRIPDTPRVVSAPPVRPLPPPIMVSTPGGAETFDSTAGSPQVKPPYPGSARNDDAYRPTPPADIPEVSRPPLDLRAEAAAPAKREHTTVAEDVLSAAKSVFHAVLPK
jgi:hypothetical protein